MLRIYVSAHCRVCDTPWERVEHLRLLRPDVPLAIVEVESPGAQVPPAIVGTPIYTWNHRVVFMGNPSERELIDRVSALLKADERARPR